MLNSQCAITWTQFTDWYMHYQASVRKIEQSSMILYEYNDLRMRQVDLRMRDTCLHWNFSLPFYAFFPQDKGSPCNLVMDTVHGKRWRTQPGKNSIETLCNSIDIDYFPSVPFWKV